MRFLITIVLVLAAVLPARGEDRPRIVTTLPPVESLLRSIAGEAADVYRLLPGGASPHTYEPRPSDLRRVEGAVALVYVDERLDGWAADLPGPPKIALFPMLPESLVIAIDGGEEDGPGSHGPGAHDHGAGPDPHFWTDPAAVRAVVPFLVLALGEIDPERRPAYEANGALLEARLDSLDRAIRARTTGIRGRLVILSHPFLRYYLRRYDIGVAAVVEPIPGKEPSARDIARLIREADKANVFAILTLPQLSPRAAELVAESTGIPVRVVDPLGGVPGRETYEEILDGITAALTKGTP
ncbi:MAG: metal ABC transporter substrate-binding protein [Candidatus Eisenbacteria bacterium]